MPGEASALDSGKPLADRVDLHDVRARGKKLIRDVLQFRKRKQRLFKKRAAAAREQKDDRVALGQIFRQRERGVRAAQGVFVRHGVPALKARDIRDLTFHVTVLRHDHTAAEIILQTRAGGVRHLPRGLSRRDEVHPS